MNNEEKTAGKTAFVDMHPRNADDETPVIVRGYADRVTIEYRGAAFRNLKRLADAMNKVARDEGETADDTPANVLWLSIDPGEFSGEWAKESAWTIAEGIDATEEHIQRLKEEFVKIDFEE